MMKPQMTYDRCVRYEVRGYRLHCGPALHRQVRPPASYGVLCSKSDWAEGLRQPGPVQVAWRTSLRCRSLAEQQLTPAPGLAQGEVETV
jgi:hypothetical protein